jgi:hypothetical protein
VKVEEGEFTSIVTLARELTEWLVRGICRVYLKLYCCAGNNGHVRILNKIVSKKINNNNNKNIIAIEDGCFLGCSPV